MAQVIGYLAAEERDAFRCYARSLQLDTSALANLLILRELKRGRLPITAKLYDRRVPANDRVKVTGHQFDNASQLAFRDHAAANGLSTARAAAILFRAELSERWLERMLVS